MITLRSKATAFIFVVSSVFFSSQVFAGAIDSDSDGVADEMDNCVLASNPLQIDFDGDGWGNTCDADYNNDGFVNFFDFIPLADAFLTSDPNLDLNEDGIINFFDVINFINQFLKPPGPAGYANWVLPADGNWDEPANWFPAAVPPPEATAFIDQPGSITVTYPPTADDLAVAGIVSEETLLIDASTIDVLTVTRDVIANGPVILDVGSLDVGGTLAVNDSLLLMGGRLVNATVTATTPPLETIVANISTLSGVTLATDLSIVNGTQINIEDGLELASSDVILNCNTNVAYVNFTNSQTVTGNGEFRFSGTTASNTLCRVRPSSSTVDLVVESGLTVRSVTSGGRLGEMSSGLDMQGPVISDVTDRRVEILGDLLSLSGAVTASGGADLKIDGVWTNESGNTISVTDGDMDLQGSWTNDGTIEATNSSAQFSGIDADTWTNNGLITLIGTPVNLDGSFALSDLGNYSSDDVLTITGIMDNSGLILDLDTIIATQLTVGNSGTILGGTISGSIPLSIGPGISNANLDGVTLGTDLSVESGSQVDVLNDLTLAGGDVLLNCDTNVAYLNFDGMQSLSGNGDVVFDGTTTGSTLCRVRQTNASSAITVGPDVTIRTGTSGGRIGETNRDLIVNGSIISNVTDRTVQLYGDVMTLNGPVTASNGGNILIDGIWSNSIGNTISANTGLLDLQGQWVNNGIIDVLNGTLEFGGVDADTWSNLGTILLAGTPLILDGSFETADLGTYTTDSTITVTGILDNTGLTLDLDTLGGSAFTIGFSGRILGGTIAGSIPITVGPSISNANLDGVTLATDLVVESGSQVDSENGLTLAGGDVFLHCDTNVAYLNFDGTQSFSGAGEVVFDGATSSDSLCRVRSSNASTELTIDSGITVKSGNSGGRLGESNRVLAMAGPVNSNLAGRAIEVFGDVLTLTGPLNASGGGEFKIDGAWINSAGNTISVADGDLDLQGSWTNDGNIVVTNSTVQMGGVDADTWINNGVLDFTGSPAILDGSFLLSDLGSYSSDDSLTITGILDNTGLTLDLDTINASELTIGFSGTIIGGTIDGTVPLSIGPSISNADLDGIVLATDLIVESGSQVDVLNGLTLSNTDVFLNCDSNVSYLNFDGTQSFSGTGEVIFDGTTTSDTLCKVRQLNNSTDLIIDSGITIKTGTSGGRIGESGRDLIMNGTAISNLAGRALQLFGDVLTVSGPVSATGGGELLIDGVWTNSLGNTISIDSGDLDLLGDWENFGTITAINSNLVFGNNINDDWTNSGTINLTDSPLDLDGLFAVTDIGTLTSNQALTLTGELENTGLILDIDTLGGTGFVIGGGARINGGTITGSSTLEAGGVGGLATFDGVTLDADIKVNSGFQLGIENDLTLNNSTVTLAAVTNVAYLNFGSSQSILGTGEILFGGTTPGNTLNWIRLTSSADILTIDTDITVRADTANGRIGGNGSAVVLNGSLVNLRAGGDVDILGTAFDLNGSITIGDDAEVVVLAGTPTLSSSADTDIDISSTGNGVLVFNNEPTLGGAANFALQGGFVPAECEAFTFMTYPSFSGAIDSVSGPDLGGGETFTVDEQPTFADAVAPGAGC